MAERKYEELAHEFCAAIKKLGENERSLENLECYLSYHFDAWMKKWAYDPECITSELKNFSKIYEW